MLNAIELGAPWPDGIKEAALLSLPRIPMRLRTPCPTDLLVLHHLYRRWAAHRLQCLPEWIRMWSTDAMFAGIPDRGAEDAWWLSSVT